MQYFEKIKQILGEILDVDEDQIGYETYLVRDLDAESIDLLEVSLELSGGFKVEINEDDIFLRNLRVFVEQAEENGENTLDFLDDQFAHLDRQRLSDMLDNLEGGPVLQAGDLERYIRFVTGVDHDS